MERFANNFTRYITAEIPNGLLPFIEVDYTTTTGSSWLFGLVLLALGVYGIFNIAAKHRLLILFYMLGTFGILMLWPDVWTGPRFLISVVPILLFVLVLGIIGLLNLAAKKLSLNKTFNPLFLLIIGLFMFPTLRVLEANADTPYPPNWQNYFELAKWTKQNTPANTVISCRKPNLFYVFANRSTFRFKDTDKPAKLLNHLSENGANYVVFAPQLGYGSDVRYLYPVIEKQPQLFPVALQYSNPDTYLLQYNSTP